MNIPENFDRWMFDYMEGNLSRDEKKAFEDFLVQNPEFEMEADAWNNAVISNENFTFPNQSALEKDRNRTAIYGWSAAAMLLVLFGVGSLFLFDNNLEAIQGMTADHAILAPSTNQHEVSTVENDALNNEIINFSNSSAENIHNNQVSGSENYSTAGNNGSNLTVGPVNHNVNVNAFESSENVNESNYIAMNDVTNDKALDQETGKYTDDGFNAKYQSNPESGDLNFDIDGNKNSVKYHSFGRSVKRFYKKIERMLEYPVGITNLRDPNLGVPQNSILAFNPGFTGGMLKPRFEMNYRNQWFDSDANSQRLTMSFDNYSYEMRGGIGVIVSATDYGMGAYGDYNASLLYSPKFVINRNVVFEPAVKLTLGALNANGNKLTPDSNIEMEKGRLITTVDDVQMKGSTQQWYKDYGLGFMLNTKWFYAGFSADNLSRHYENVYSEDLADPARTDVKYTAVAGFDYESQDSRKSSRINRSLSPYVIFQQFGGQPELWAGSNFRWDWFTFGGSYSTQNEFTASIGIHFEKFKMIYHYDMTESTLLGDKIGSHNIGIRFNAKRKNTRLN